MEVLSVSKFPDRKIQRERSKQAKWAEWAEKNKDNPVGKKTFEFKDMTPHNAWMLSQGYGKDDVRLK